MTVSIDAFQLNLTDEGQEYNHLLALPQFLLNKIESIVYINHQVNRSFQGYFSRKTLGILRQSGSIWVFGIQIILDKEG